MSNDPEYVNKCLVTIYLLSQPNINLNLAKCGCHLSIVYLLCIVWVSVLGSRYSSKVILIMFLCRTCSDICNIHFTEQERPQFLWEVTLGETNTVAVIQRGETSRLEVAGIARNNGKTANTISPSHFCSQVLSLFYLIWSLRFLLFLIIKLNIDCLPAPEHFICTFSWSSLGLRRINLIYMFFGFSGKTFFFCISIPFEFSLFLFSENKLNLHDF